MYLDWRGEWRLPPLNGIASAPLLQDDGAINSTQGYDLTTGMWCENVPDLNGLVSAKPTMDDAAAALRLIRETFKTFCFADTETIEPATGGVATVDTSEDPEKTRVNSRLFRVLFVSTVATPPAVGSMVSGLGEAECLEGLADQPERRSRVILRRRSGNQPGEIGHVLAPHARVRSYPCVLLIVPSSCSSGADAMPFSGGSRHSPRQSRYMTASERGRRALTSATCLPPFSRHTAADLCAISTRASGVIICATVPRWIWSKARRTGTPRS